MEENRRRKVSANGGNAQKSGKRPIMTADITVNEMTVATTAQTNVAIQRKSRYLKPVAVRRVKGSMDMTMLILVVILTLLGLITIFSASYAYCYTFFDDSFHFFNLQLRYALIGIVAMIGVSFFNYEFYRKFTIPAYIVTIALLFLVLVYGLAAGEAQRWIMVGPVSVQPSEIAKLSIPMILAMYVSRQQDRIINYGNFRQSLFYGIIIPGIILAIPCGLILLENHFSGLLIVFGIGACIIYVSGANKKILFTLAGIALLVVGLYILATPYARTRIDMYLNPDKYDPKGKIWQTLQGLNAIGSGGIFGVGIGNSKQKYLFVSQPQNDFIFSILCEETGFAGATFVIILFMLLAWRGFVTAQKAPDTFSSLLAFGITAKLVIQTILNIAVVTNTIPNTGVALPFFSYGGTALIMQLFEMGILLSISRYSYAEKHEIDELAVK